MRAVPVGKPPQRHLTHILDESYLSCGTQWITQTQMITDSMQLAQPKGLVNMFINFAQLNRPDLSSSFKISVEHHVSECLHSFPQTSRCVLPWFLMGLVSLARYGSSSVCKLTGDRQKLLNRFWAARQFSRYWRNNISLFTASLFVFLQSIGSHKTHEEQSRLRCSEKVTLGLWIKHKFVNNLFLIKKNTEPYQVRGWEGHLVVQLCLIAVYLRTLCQTNHRPKSLLTVKPELKQV